MKAITAIQLEAGETTSAILVQGADIVLSPEGRVIANRHGPTCQQLDRANRQDAVKCRLMSELASSWIAGGQVDMEDGKGMVDRLYVLSGQIDHFADLAEEMVAAMAARQWI